MPTFTPVDFDPFAGPPAGGVQTVPGQNGAPTRVIMDMGKPSEPKLVPVDHDPFAQPSPAYDQAADILKGFGGGLVRGAANTIGFVTDTAPNFIADQLNWLDGKVRGETPEQTQARVASERADLPDWLKAAGENLSVSGIQRNIESVTGPAYVPHTRAGRFASTAAEFVPGAMVPLGGPVRAGTMARDALAFGVVPGLVSEGAGQLFEGGAMEGPARVAGGLVGGLGSAGAMRSGVAGNMVRDAVGNVTPQQLDATEQLFQRAQQAGQPISRAEALQAVTSGSTNIGDLHHTVEGMGGLKDFYTQRPAQNEVAARRAFDTITPQAANPSQIGPTVGSVAQQVMRTSPEGRILEDTLFQAGPRVTPEQAGNVIQQDLRNVYDRREGMRAALADQDYGAARNAEATIPLNGGHRVADVTKHYLDRPNIPIILDEAERAAARAQWLKDNNPTSKMPIVGERATEFGQVDASAVLRQLDGALDTAKGAVRQGLQAARSALFKPDGTLDMSVAGLHNSRQAIDDLISQAKRAGANQTVMRLQETKRTLDHALEQVPAYGDARANFQVASRPLEPFDRSRAPGKIIERDEFNSRFVMPPERVPGTIQNNGPSAAREFNAVASPAAREAFEQHIVTQVLDRASREGADLSADSIRTALRQNEDLLRQYPGIRDRLESIAIARDGLSRLENTPVGKLAQRDLTTKQAVAALFSENPLPGSQHEIADAIGTLVERSPGAARQLVRTHAESMFNEATQRLASSGPNQSGGAKFAAVVRGNSQQAANLEAAVRALPNGDTTWNGFNRFLDILEAQQFRQATGSRTAFKIPGVEDLKGGGLANNAAQIVASGGFKWPQKAMQSIQNWNVGRNMDDLARLLTDPAAADQFRAIATAPRGSSKALALTARLAITGANSRNFESRPRVEIDTTSWRGGATGPPR